MTLLTTDEFRAFVATGLDDPSLQLLLDAAEAEIDAAAGPVGSTLELVCGGYTRIVLARPASAIGGITETRSNTVTTLAADDYLLYPGGYVIERLTGGTNSSWHWRGRVAVTYTPLDDADIRKGVQLDLVRLAITFQPGVTMETIGAWTQQMASNSTWNNSEERASILGRLTPEPMLAIVGC